MEIERSKTTVNPICQRVWVVAACLLVWEGVSLASPARGRAEEHRAVRAREQHTTADSVREAHYRLEQWLGHDRRREDWHRYLRSPQLQMELPKESEADIHIVKQILDLYDHQQVSAKNLRFIEMRLALESWLRELEAVPRDRLPDVVRHARGTFQMPTDDELSGKREGLRRRVAELEAYLNRGGDAYAAAWKKYLHWDVLQAQLEEEKADLQQLNRVLQQFYTNQEGLERPIFSHLRRHLHDYMNISLVHATPNMAEQFDEQLTELADNLADFEESPSATKALTIAQALGWLNSAGQANHVLHTVRQHYAQPNFYATVSTQFAALGVNNTVDETQPIQDCILGTSLRGTARTRGDLRLKLIPNPERAEFEIMLDGVAVSDNVGVNRGVTIYSQGTTQIDARKRIFFDAEGLRDNGANATCDTSSVIQGIGHRSALVRKIAWKRAHQQKGPAEKVASRRAERRVEGQMNERAEEMLAQPRQDFLKVYRNPLLRRGEFPQVFDATTSTDGIILRILQAQMHHLGAPSAPPVMDDDFDFALRIHESFAGNFSEAVLGGYTLTDEGLVEFLEKNERDVPDELRPENSPEPWSITFSTSQPVRVEFRDETITIELRGRRFTRGEQRVNEEMKISAVYVVERTDEGARFIRQGDVQAEYVRQGFENAPKIAVKTLMRTKFGALFKPEFSGEGLQLPGNWGKSGPLKLGQFDSNGGWLVAGWDLGGADSSAIAQSTSGDSVR